MWCYCLSWVWRVAKGGVHFCSQRNEQTWPCFNNCKGWVANCARFLNDIILKWSHFSYCIIPIVFVCAPRIFSCRKWKHVTFLSLSLFLFLLRSSPSLSASAVTVLAGAPSPHISQHTPHPVDRGRIWIPNKEPHRSDPTLGPSHKQSKHEPRETCHGSKTLLHEGHNEQSAWQKIDF